MLKFSTFQAQLPSKKLKIHNFILHKFKCSCFVKIFEKAERKIAWDFQLWLHWSIDLIWMSPNVISWIIFLWPLCDEIMWLIVILQGLRLYRALFHFGIYYSAEFLSMWCEIPPNIPKSLMPRFIYCIICHIHVLCIGDAQMEDGKYVNVSESRVS
jgi:hypothetical protein